MRMSHVLIAALVLIVCESGLAASTSKEQSRSEKLDKTEYAIVALIYNEELQALGDAAIYPVCITAAVQMLDTKSLLRYLRQAGFPISNDTVCFPPNGPFKPDRDYPHGMSLAISEVQHSSGKVQIKVDATDNTPHFNSDFATLLRRGTYHFRQNQEGEWRIASYMKQYDFRDQTQDTPKCTHKPRVTAAEVPFYPPAPWTARFSGTVTIEVTVEKGTIVKSEVKSVVVTAQDDGRLKTRDSPPISRFLLWTI